MEYCPFREADCGFTDKLPIMDKNGKGLYAQLSKENADKLEKQIKDFFSLSIEDRMKYYANTIRTGAALLTKVFCEIIADRNIEEVNKIINGKL